MPKLVLLWISAAFLAGIITAGVAPISSAWSLGFIPAILILLYSFFQRKKGHSKQLVFVSLFLLSFFSGALRYQFYSRESAPNLITESAVNEPLILQGVVVEPTLDYLQYSETVIELQSIVDSSGNRQSVDGKVSVRLPVVFNFEYHTSLTLQGTLVPAVNANGKAHTSWLKRNGVDYQMFYPTVVADAPAEGFSFMGILYAFRSRAHQMLQSIIPFPESELLAGILLGIESRIPDYLSEAYRLTGTAHIIAISGFNIALISGIISKFFNRILPYRTGALVSILVIALYALFVGAQPSVLRAALMGIISIPAYLIGRRVIGIHTLAITAACMALFNPYLLWDVSFQLSICATFGILMFADFFTKKADLLLQRSALPSKEFLLGVIKDFLITTFSAQVATFPVLISHFKEFSLISPVVNLLILPLQPAIMILGGIALLSGLLFYPFGRLVGLITWFVAVFNDQIVLLFSQIPLTFALNRIWGFWIGLGLNVLLVFLVLREQRKSQPYLEISQG
ncbi:MAG: ComEC/Rec2 family competence protein [Anaerolineaceae bacterium]